MIKFNDDNIYVGYIKQLLKTFNLPTCRVYNEDYKFASGELFLYKDKIYKSPTLGTIQESTIKDLEVFYDNYIVNDKILNITKNLEIRNNYYDSYTHSYLGEYLRFIRDYFGIDLMSMYNCFANESPVNMSIAIPTSDSAEFSYSISTKDSGYAIYMIPVKSNTTYTIALEYPFSFSIFCGFYANNNYINLNDDEINSTSSLEYKSFKTIKSTRFSCPFTYKTPELISNEQIYQEDNMKLFIVIPQSFSSNIVVLEGDYTKSTKLILNEYSQVLSDKMFEYVVDDEYAEGPEVGTHLFSNDEFNSKHQLLMYSTQTKYLLADRLLEYLSDNVVTPIDEIVNNIKRVQLYLMSEDFNTFRDDLYGFWNDKMRKWLYVYMAQTNVKGNTTTYLDLINDVLGYVDKDVESILRTFKIDNPAIISKLNELGGN